MKKAHLFILLSLAESSRYGSAIQEDVRSLSSGGTRLWPATLYGSLEDLAERGWIRECASPEPGAGAGRGRERFYQITSAGRQALTSEIEAMEFLTGIARARIAGHGSA